MFKMDKTMKIICLILIIAIAISSVALVGVLISRGEQSTTTTTDNNVPDDGKVAVTWRQGGKILKEERVEIGSKVSSWTPTVDGKEFLGWFSNPGLTTAFDFNTAINEDTVIYASFKTVGAVDPIEPVYADYYLIGTGVGSLVVSNWSHDASATNLGMTALDNGTYTITIDMFAGDKFQICHGLSWDGQMGLGCVVGSSLVEGSESEGEVRDDQGNVIFTGTQEYSNPITAWNITLAEGQDGRYTFVLDPDAGTITWKLEKKLDPSDIPDIPVGDVIYTVAGNAGLCGSEWSCDDALNDMTLDDATGLYTITYENIPAGSYQFKICENHAWSVSYGDPNNAADSNNVNITVANDDTTVVITFDPATKAITAKDAQGNDLGGASAPVNPDADSEIIFIGTMNEWSTTAGDEWLLTQGSDGKTWTGTLVVTEDMYADWTVAELGQLCAAVKLYDKTTGTWIAYEGDSNLALTVGTYHFKYVEGDANFTYWADGDQPVDPPVNPPVTPEDPEDDSVYTVAGGVAGSSSDAGFLGAYWDPSSTANNMTLSGNVYTITYTGVAIGQYEFKICENHGWDVCYGDSLNPSDGNFKIDVTSANTTVVITFNPETKKITAKDASGNDLSVDFSTPVVPGGETTKVYVQNSAGWSTLYCYCWNASNTGYVSWPGEEMTYDAAKDLWYYEIPAGYINVIFNNGSGTQTSDLSTPTTNAVAYDNATRQWYTVENLPQGDVEVTDIWGIVGSFSDWGNDVVMTEVSNGVWEATVELSAGDTFKVRKNYDWAVNFGQDGLHNGADISVPSTGTYKVRLSNIVEGESATLEYQLQ